MISLGDRIVIVGERFRFLPSVLLVCWFCLLPRLIRPAPEPYQFDSAHHSHLALRTRFGDSV